MTQQIDMSGYVDGLNGLNDFWASTDLTPFTQGAIKAALGELNLERFRRLGDSAQRYYVRLGFRHLAPETLAWFIAEGERFTQMYGEWPLEEHGRGFWEGRQRDKHSPEFEPVTLTVRDDGLIYGVTP